MDNEVLRRFIRLGLTPVQAQIYVFLTRRKRRTLDAIENGLGLPQDVVLKALTEMEKKGIVRMVERRGGGSFIAVDSDVMVDKLLGNLERRLEETRQESRQLKLWLATLSSSPDSGLVNPQVFRIFTGPVVFSKMLALTTEARRRVLRIGSAAGLQVNLRLGIFDVEKDRVKKGVDVRAIISRDPLLEPIVNEYKEVAKVRLVEPNPDMPRFTIIDGATMFFTSLPTTSPRKHIALLTTNKMVVDGMRRVFDRYWKSLLVPHRLDA